ncbi:MAG: hypothetical protein IPM29_22830 [Planctomycetes bacterium]|nr:hypothetical protein [Planctomycetota bacterium]
MPLLSRPLAACAAAIALGSLALAQGNPAQDTAPTTGARGTVPGTPRTGVEDGANVIYSNGPFVTHVGGGAGGLDASALENVTLGLSIFGYSGNGATGNPAAGFRMADDFTVPDGQMWYVESVKVFAYRTQTAGSPALVFTDGVARIWDGAPNAGGTVIFGDTTTNRLVSSTFDNSYRVLEATLTNDQRAISKNELQLGVLLKPGTYWIEYGLNDASLGSAFLPPVTRLGFTGNGNALQLTVAAGTWAGPVTSGTALYPQDMPFELCGEIACCFENDMGAALTPPGDDTTYRNLAVPSFSMPGGLGTTNAIDVCTNGYVYLQTNLRSADFSPSVSELLTNEARICVPWNDFDPSAAGNVRLRTTGLRTIVTWERVATFAQAGSENIVQLQMFPNGSFTINSWIVVDGFQSPIFGISPGNGAADPGETDFSASLPFSSAVGTVYEAFSNSSGADRYDLNGQLVCFQPNAAGGFDVSATRACCTFATSAAVAPGCFGMSTTVVNNAVIGGTAELSTALPPGTFAQLTLLGLVAAPFALDLTPIGAPGCGVHYAFPIGDLPMDAAGTSLVPLPCLAVLLGQRFVLQGIAVAPVNPLGVALGDAFDMTIGNL